MNLQNLKISLRLLLKNKFISSINIFGLSIGITCVIIIFLYIQFELSFDQHHSDKDQIFRLTYEIGKDADGEIQGETPFPLGEAVRLNMENLDDVVRIQHSTDRVLHFKDKKLEIEHVMFADKSFFNVFDVEWIVGSAETSFNDPSSIILTESISKKIFGESVSMNEIVDLERLYKLKVAGIIKDPVYTSSIIYDIIIPIETLTPDFIGLDYNQWTITLGGFMAFVKLPKNSSSETFELQLNDMYKSLIFDNKDEWNIYLQPITEIHFDKDLSSLTYTIDKKILLILGLVGFLILVIACINYINLSIPQAIKRSKEVGIRKVVGAQKRKLFEQFLLESLIIVSIAFIIAILLSEVLLPYINNIIGNEYNLRMYDNPLLFGFLIFLFLTICFITGIYPSVLISRFKPVEAIKNKITSHSKPVNYLRNGLLIFQMIVAQILIVCAIIISQQVDYFFSKDLGFKTESIVCFPIPDVDKLDVLRSEFSKNPNIEEFSAGIAPPQAEEDHRFTSYFITMDTEQREEISCELKTVDEHYFNTFDLQLAAGEWMPENGFKDSTRCIIINETTSRILGFDNPTDVLGYRINMGRITGVLKDFHLESFHSKITPMVMFYYPRFFGYAFAKINPQNKNGTVNQIKKEWLAQFPDHVFTYDYYDDYLKNLYQEELRIFDLIKIFSVLAIIIACLGLFGIISFLLLQKEKEISIRKVFGASLAKLFSLLTKNYVIMVLIANIIAIPVSLYAMNEWLNNYMYRIEIGVIPFVFAILLTLGITLLTISYQTLKTALTNPINTLKHE
jgi:putative ABC transport system permease protein